MRTAFITTLAFLIAGTSILLLVLTAVFFIGIPDGVTPAFALQTMGARFLVMGLIVLISSGIFRLGARFSPQDKMLALLASRKALLAGLVLSLVLLIAIWGPEVLVTK